MAIHVKQRSSEDRSEETNESLGSESRNKHSVVWGDQRETYAPIQASCPLEITFGQIHLQRDEKKRKGLTMSTAAEGLYGSKSGNRLLQLPFRKR